MNTVCNVRAEGIWYFVSAVPYSSSTSAEQQVEKRAKVGSKSPTHWNAPSLFNTHFALKEEIQLLLQRLLITVMRKMMLLKNLTHS